MNEYMVFLVFPKWLLDYDISSDAKILYVYIYNLANCSVDEGVYITSVEIEKKLRLSQFKRRKVLYELKEAGLIKRINRGTKTRTFICIPNAKSDEPSLPAPYLMGTKE